MTETSGATVKRTYEVESELEPTDVDDLSGATLVDLDCDDYDMEELVSVEESR